MKIKRIMMMVYARNTEFFRDRGALLWNIFFPVFMVFGFAIAFSSVEGRDVFTVGLYGVEDEASVQMLESVPIANFRALEYIAFVEYDDLAAAQKKLRQHEIDFLLDVKNRNYFVNTESPQSYFMEKLFLNEEITEITRKTLDGSPIRYIDWFVPSAIGMNITFSSLFGFAFVIVRYRKNGVLKRLKATPLLPSEFVLSQLISRLIITVTISLMIYIGTNLALNFVMLGSYLLLFCILLLAIICFLALGLVFAARVKSEELAGGLMNLLMWPMMIFSGVFFPLERMPKFMQDFSNIFPLTHFLKSTRAIMIDGANLGNIFPNVLTLGVMACLFITLASILFKWE